MTNLHIIFLATLPICFAQFSIQGPSDGNREAQGLKYSEEKGIEYGNQRESQGTGDFSIQGASDGNSNFQIQGASDGHSQSSVQGPYVPNQAAQRALQYNDPDGFQVNWRSYGHSQQQQQAQQQPQQYRNVQHQNVAENAPAQHAPAAQRAPQPVHQAETNIAQQHAINYRPYTNAPNQIKEILQFQSQIPYKSIIPEQYSFEALLAAQAQGHSQNRGHQSQGPQPSEEPQYQPQYNPKSRGHSRPKRQGHQHQAQPSEQQHQQQQYKRISQPTPEPQPQYSANVPSQIQQLLNYQAQIPYNVIANQIVYRPDKPYVPQPVAPASAGNGAASYNQGQGSYGQDQGQGYYGQGQASVRPVKEQ